MQELFLWGVPEDWGSQNERFRRENPTNMDDLGVPTCQETPICHHFIC